MLLWHLTSLCSIYLVGHSFWRGSLFSKCSGASSNQAPLLIVFFCRLPSDMVWGDPAPCRALAGKCLAVSCSKVLPEAALNRSRAPCFQLAPDDAWRCPHCKQLQQGSITLSLWTLPDVLIIHLKRFRQVRKPSVIGKKAATKFLTPLTGGLLGGELFGVPV